MIGTPTSRGIERIVRSIDRRRPLRTWRAGALALIVCICTGGEGVRAAERLVPSLATPDVTGESSASTRAQGLAEADDPKLRYLINELIDQRFEGARLSIELEEARAEAAQIKEISHQQAHLLTALVAALRVRDRLDASSRTETADIRHRLEAAQTELKRERVENRRLAAELVAAQKAANW